MSSIFTEYYRAGKLTNTKSRFDITASTNIYDYFEKMLINKRKFNVGGLSFNLVQRPQKWKGRKTDLAIVKGSDNITSVKRPDIESNVAYGDIKGKRDGCIIVFNDDHRDVGINTIEIFIARGLKNDMINLWYLFTDGEMDHEIEALRERLINRLLK